MAHHHDPAQAFVQKVTQGLIIGNRQNGVGQELNFVALFGDEAAHEQVVGSGCQSLHNHRIRPARIAW